MAAFAVNILALLMVIGLCWAAMMWLSGRLHGHGRTVVIDDFTVEDFEVADMTRRPPAPCSMCEGVGASHRRGRLQPCPQCEGTGVLQ